MSNYKLTSPIDVKSSSTSGQINLFSAGSSNRVSIKAPPTLTGNVDFTLPSTVGTTGQFLQRTGATSLGWGTPSTNTSVLTPIQTRTYADSTTPDSSTTSTLQVVFTLYFPGSSTAGVPSAAYILYSPSDNSTTCQVQIQDITNSTIIANVVSSTFAANSINLINLGTLSNISSGSALWQINFARAAGAGTASLLLFKLLG